MISHKVIKPQSNARRRNTLRNGRILLFLALGWLFLFPSEPGCAADEGSNAPAEMSGDGRSGLAPNGTRATGSSILGDLNLDGWVDGSDRMLLSRCLAGGNTPEFVAPRSAADVNSDGRVDGADLAVLERWCPPAGATLADPRGFVSWQVGDGPLILSVPHGGDLRPADLPDRTCAGSTTVQDANTEDLALRVAEAIRQRTGRRPHLIINHLHRKKLDPNRDLAEGACAHPLAEQAWQDYHNFLEMARDFVQRNQGNGLYLDLHGHGHPDVRIELGYLLYPEELRLTDEALDDPLYVNISSLRHLVAANAPGLTHSALLRGEWSLGALLEAAGYPCVPSDRQGAPAVGEEYYSGGYCLARYSSYLGGTVDGIQMECPLPGIRDTQENRQRFALALAEILDQFLDHMRLP